MSEFAAGSPAPRRSFLARLAAGAAAFAAASAIPDRAQAMAAASQSTEEPWLKPLTGKHKQVFDATAPNDGFPFIFAHNYLVTMTDAYGLKPGEANAIVVTRRSGIVLALSDAVWAKYKLGAMFNVIDPATKEPSVRNLYNNSRPGDMTNPAASADKLVARGAVIGACNLALTLTAGRAAAGAGVTADVALAEFKAGLLPGAHVVPSGVLAIGRAQEKGCTYCYAG